MNKLLMTLVAAVFTMGVASAQVNPAKPAAPDAAAASKAAASKTAAAASASAPASAAAVTAPRDAATGMASGKRMHKPVTITKEVDAKAAPASAAAASAASAAPVKK